jgi:hypothetical protein
MEYLMFDSWTALHTCVHMATYENNDSFVSYVVEHSIEGANVNATTWDSKTPLHFALSCAENKNSYVVMNILIDNGSNIHATDRQGDTPLHFAVLFCNYKVLVKLIEKGADVNATNNKGKTPLEHAIAADNLNIAKYLIVLTKPNYADINMPYADNSTTMYLKEMHELATYEPDNSAASALAVGGNEIQNEVATKLSSMVKSTVDIHNSKIAFAKALFGMSTTDKAEAMVKFMMFNLTFKIKGSYSDAIVITKGLVKSHTKEGKTRPSLCPDVIGIILNFAGLMPGKTSIDAITHPYYKALNSSQVKSSETAVKYSSMQNDSIIESNHGSPAAAA